MTIEEIKQLIHVVHETGIAELEVQRGDNRVRIRRSGIQNTQELILPGAIPAPTVAATPNLVSAPSSVPIPPVSDSIAADEARNILVKSPIVGTFYDGPAPGSPAFVKVGDSVEPKQVLCIIESMKLMNEIEAETAGTIVAKVVENGRPVEYGETLFIIRPR